MELEAGVILNKEIYQKGYYTNYKSKKRKLKKQARVYYAGYDKIKYVIVDLNDLSLMSAMIAEFFFKEYNKAKEN